jgi:hypothetical protein
MCRAHLAVLGALVAGSHIVTCSLCVVEAMLRDGNLALLGFKKELRERRRKRKNGERKKYKNLISSQRRL